MKEFRISHDDPCLKDPQQITQLNIEKFAEQFDGDERAIHKHEVDGENGIIDDFDTKERIYRVKSKKYFVMGR